MCSSFLPNPSDVVNPTAPSSRRSSPHGATPVTTAPPAGVPYAAAAVRSPRMIVVFVQSALASVLDTTYFGRTLTRRPKDSSSASDGQKAAQI